MKKILICNNNNKILTNIKQLMASQNIEFDLANSYDVLLDFTKKALSKNKSYPVIVTDLNVKQENGADRIGEISKENPDSTIIALYSFNDFSVEWINSSVRENKNILFLKKPFEDIELIQLVKNNLLKVKNTKVVEKCDISGANKHLLENISHEIRTPLASIVGITELLQQTRLSDEQSRHVKAILRCSDSLLTIMSDMIDFESVRDKEIELNTSDFSFTDLVEGCVNLVARQGIEKDIDINLSISDNVPTFIHSDEARIRKLIWNILTNAVKYTNYGNVSVFCDYIEDKKFNTLTIDFKDTGIGISKDSISSLFKHFDTTDNLYRSGGSGIGLAMTKKILDAFKGKIEVKSIVDQGSVFSISIPVETVYDKSLQLQFGKFTPLNNTNGILIASNELTAEAIIPQFAKQNCHLMHANTIRNARVKIQNNDKKITWCIIDDSVTTTDNIDLLKNLILSCKQNNIKILHLAKSQKTINMMHSIGIFSYINKPCLEREIRKVLSYHSETSPSSKVAPSLIPMDKIKKVNPLKILIAEDNEINQMVLSDMIKRNGHSFEIARHGKIAVDKAAMNNYDLVLMDIQMPIMNGLEAAKQIRLGNKKLPIIAMTANIAESTKQECALVGMDKFLTKPISESSLRRILQEFSK